MSERVFRIVRHSEVEAYTRVGWTRQPTLDATHHGEWSALVEWTGEGEPVIPALPPLRPLRRTRQAAPA